MAVEDNTQGSTQQNPAENTANQYTQLNNLYQTKNSWNTSPLLLEALQQNPTAYIPPNPEVGIAPSRGGFSVFTGGQPQIPFGALALKNNQPMGQAISTAMLKKMMEAPKAYPLVELNIKNRFSKEIMQDDWLGNAAKFGANNWAQVINTGIPRTPEEAQALQEHTKKMNTFEALADMSTKLGGDLDKLKENIDKGYLIDPRVMQAHDEFYKMPYDNTTPTLQMHDRMVQLDSYLQTSENLKKQLEDYLPTNMLLNKSFTINQATDSKGNAIPGGITVISTENDENGNPKIDPATGKTITQNITDDLRRRAQTMWDERGDNLKDFGVKGVDDLLEHMKYILPHAQEVKVQREQNINISNQFGEKQPRYYVVAAQAFNKAVKSFQNDYPHLPADTPAQVLYSDFAHRLPYKNDGQMNADGAESGTLGVNIKQWNGALNTKIKEPDFSNQGSEIYYSWQNGKMRQADDINVPVENNKQIGLQELFSNSLSEKQGTVPTTPVKKYSPSMTIAGIRQVFGNDNGEGQPTETIQTEEQFRDMASKKDSKWKPYFEVQYNLSYSKYDENGNAKVLNIPIRQYIDATNQDLVSMFDHKMEGLAESHADVNPNTTIPNSVESTMTH